MVLPGWNQSSEEWREIQSRFGTGFLVLDLPGFGSEPLVSRSWGVPEYAEWVEKKLQNLGSRDVILLGHSFGGRIACHLASRGTAGLKGLILYAAPCLYRSSAGVRFRNLLAKALRFLPGAAKRAFSRNPEWEKAKKSGYEEIFIKAVRFDQTDSLENIKVPTLIVWGELDAEVPLFVAREIHKGIGSSSLEVLPGLGHNAHLENPNLFYGKVKKFVESIK